MNEWLRARTEGARRFWLRLTATQKASLIGAVVAVVAAVVMLTAVGTRTEYSPLFTNLDSKDAGNIQTRLKDEKVPYRITGNGSTIEVPSSQVYELRNSLAMEGLPSGSNVMGYEIFDKYSGIGGGTDFTQQIDKQRALEGELARTISKVNGVDAATVRLVLTEQELYSEKEKPASASVFLKMKNGSTLDPGATKGITHLVASSVQGLDAKKVTVVDTDGNILSSENDVSTSSLAKNQIGLQRNIEESYKNKVQSMLDKVLGPNKSVAQVSVELDWTARETIKKLTGKPVPEATETSKETYTGPGSNVGGVAGVMPNIPTYQGQATGANNGATNYTKADSKVRNLIPQTEVKEIVSPGSIKKISVSVLYDGGQAAAGANNAQGGVPAQVAASIQQIVQTAVGIDTRRGDRVTVAQMPFDTTAATEAKTAIADAQKQNTVSSAIKYSLTAFGLLLLLLFLRRGLRPVIGPLPGFDAELAAGGAAGLQAPIPISELQITERGADMETAVQKIREKRELFHPEAALEEGARRTEVQERVDEIVDDRPEDVARVISTWLMDKQRM